MSEPKLGDFVKVEFEGSEIFPDGTVLKMQVMRLDPVLVGPYYVGELSFVFGPDSYKEVQCLN